MLQPITDQNKNAALGLLVEGFPKRDRKFWSTALARLEDYSGNKRADVPIGYVAGPDDDPFGVMLTPADSVRTAPGKPSRVVNLSSWYVKEAHRWRAPMMLQKVLKLDDAAFTDLTPTPPVQKMLLALGFERINDGVSINLLPLSRLKPATHTSVVDCDELEDGACTAVASELRCYQQFDCFVAVLREAAHAVTLVFKRVHVRGLPAAMLVFCEENEAVYRNIPAIARYLAQKNLYLLMLDIPLDRQIPGISRKKRGNKFAKGLNPNGRTDFLGTELSLFDW